MRVIMFAFIFGSISLSLGACGGGGSGGGGTGKTAVKLNLFGNLSTNSTVKTLSTTLNVPNFVDYSSSSNDINNTSEIRGGVLKVSGQASTFSVSGNYNKITQLLTLTLVNDISSSITINGATGTELAIVQLPNGTTLPTSDTSPRVGYYRSLPFKTGFLTGCSVAFTP